ncbi:MAG: hypothetical protein M1275_02325 [Patescibacteria group bacterium]|nr:hypothetical protein [Patescibacteria group bacterium]
MKRDLGLYSEWSRFCEDFGLHLLPGMEQVFLMLFALARSSSDLRRLHDELLLPNYRLNRQDFLRLETLWKQYFLPTVPAGTKPMPREQAFFLLNFRGPAEGMEQYYIVQLEAAAGKVYRTLGDSRCGGWEYVYSAPSRSGQGYFHYKIELRFRAESFELCCMVNAVGRTRVLIRLWGHGLTEPLVHQFLHEIPKFDFARVGGSSDKGANLNIIYEFDGLGIEGLLKQGPPLYSADHFMKIGGQDFLQALVGRLRAMGIPIANAITIE